MPRPWTPRAYQDLALRLMLEQPAFGLLADPGLGKTSVSLAATSILQAEGVVRRALVIAPLRVARDVWPVEAKEWTDFQHLRVVVLHGPKKDELLREDADVYVVNPEGLPWLATIGRKAWRWPELLIVDESTKFKHTRTQRFKILKALLPRFTRRYILTGSPAPNGLLDLFGQAYILDFGEALGRYITHYRREFFDEGWDGYSWEPKAGAEQRIYDRLKDLVLRLDRNELDEMPDLVKTTIGVTLPKMARKQYDELADEFVLRLRAGEVTAVNAGVLTSKLRQAANGRVYYDAAPDDAAAKKRRVAPIHEAKLDALEDLIEELQGNPILVAYEFQHDLDALRSRFGADLPYLGGGVSAARGSELIREWNRGRLPILAVHPASAGHGLNLQAGGHHLAWYGMTWNLEHHDQTIARIWRQGQTERVFVYYLIARQTVDAAILQALEGKAKTQQDLLDALKRELT